MLPDTDLGNGAGDEYSIDRYVYRGGQRLRTGFVRTIRPHVAETNGAFQTRMDAMALQLAGMAGVTSVELTFERGRGGAIVECVATVEHTPRVEAVLQPDNRPAGGRPPHVARNGRAHQAA